MNPPEADGPLAADEPLDRIDLAILEGIREIFDSVDPMPLDLPERVRFSLALRDLEVEMARHAAEEEPVLAVRGEEQSRTITFDSQSLTIMIRIDANRDGTARVDGWLAPPQPCEVEIKTVADPLSVRADEQGRFAFTRVPRGTAQVVVRPQAEGPSGTTGRTVVTPVLIL
jgi:hypothetical protein